MKIIGSRAALMLVRKKFGERAYVARYKKTFAVGLRFAKLGSYTGNRIIGWGKSWADALTAAGIPVILEAKSVTPDSMPEEGGEQHGCPARFDGDYAEVGNKPTVGM